MGRVLIVPYGIEIHIDRLNEEARLVLIVPYGIEINESYSH